VVSKLTKLEKRESNQEAHELAKLAKNFVFNSFWLGCVPAEVVSVVQADDVNKLKLSLPSKTERGMHWVEFYSYFRWQHLTI
jgi:hypothetical protein